MCPGLTHSEQYISRLRCFHFTEDTRIRPIERSLGLGRNNRRRNCVPRYLLPAPALEVDMGLRTLPLQL